MRLRSLEVAKFSLLKEIIFVYLRSASLKMLRFRDED